MITTVPQLGLITPSTSTLHWLQGDAGQAALTSRAKESSQLLLEAGLAERIRTEFEASKAGGSKVFRIGNTLRGLCGDLTILALAHQCGVKVAPEAWEAGRLVVSSILGLDALVFQGRTATPPWKADLWTADIGINLAVVSHFATPLELDQKAVNRFLDAECWKPIHADWIDDATRVHALDSMGHNWWSVIVGGSGIVASLTGRKKESLAICDRLAEWFAYPGNSFARKNRNFGAEGDFVEGFSYGEYALLHPLMLSFLTPEYETNPAWLTSTQREGLAAWFKRAFVKTSDGAWWPQRFGDIHFSYRARVEIWHTLARWLQDEELLAHAHQLKPLPHLVFEFLMWEPLPSAPTRPKPARAATPRTFSTSGLAFLGDKNVTLTVRAGEFWNHNHLDAGSFIHHEKEVMWIDDCGVCVYSKPEYVGYYTTPRAHNVAYAPDLAPPNPSLAAYESLPLQGHLLFHERTGAVEVLGTDTNALSCGALARSHRTFLVLDDAVTLIWDDLQAHHPQSFDFLLHTIHGQQTGEANTSLTLQGPDGETNHLRFFSETPFHFSAEEVDMGELSKPDAYSHGDPLSSLRGTCLRWRTMKTLRQKFGLTLGCTLRDASWQAVESGWESSFQAGTATWSVWFNRLADGGTMHRNPIAIWRGFETDAYALALREENGRQSLYVVQASFVRRDGKVLQGTLRRSVLAQIDL